MLLPRHDRSVQKEALQCRIDSDADYDADAESLKGIGTHYIFLVHGWLGSDSEVSYIQGTLEDMVNKMKKNENRQDEKVNLNVNVNGNHHSNNDHRIVVHSTVDNVGKTYDGIAAGGLRLASEIERFILNDQKLIQTREHVHSSHKHAHATISIVGNSLGGLYSRYAIPLIPETLTIKSDADDETCSSKHQIVLHRNVFYTTATPHLGIAHHTYLPLSRTLEFIVGNVMSRSIHDMFRLDEQDLLYQMATHYQNYLQPLSKFKKRVAYANAYMTDFPVPTETAAFLSKNSESHHFLLKPDHDANNNTHNHPSIVATIVTDTNTSLLTTNKFDNQLDTLDKLDIMSTKLDALGWNKIFVDLRDLVPTFSIPNPFWKHDSTVRSKWKIREEQGPQNISYQEIKDNMIQAEKYSFPLGHIVLIANSKSKWHSKVTNNGKPIMDQMATQLLHDILSFSFEVEETQLETRTTSHTNR